LRICFPFNMTFITFIKLIKSSSNSWWPSKYQEITYDVVGHFTKDNANVHNSMEYSSIK
jgi:hypothetical protein